MSEKQSLTLEQRTLVGKKVNRLRRAGIIPATVYGKGVGPFAVQVNARTFNALFRKAGKTSLVELSIPGQPIQSAFIHAIQRHPVTREIMHADFWVMDLKTEISVEVPVHLVGESPLAARGDAVINHTLNTVTVHALPADVPQYVEADVSVLDGLDKNVHVRDLVIPGGKATILTDGDQVAVSITPARTEAEESPTGDEAPAEPELVREDRSQDEQ
ncbi:MAG TPA: 50S ribosomal protein L25 [Roseiflexaceae bacterium]|nr:50S ribosomal protein L25 [Roseiflexaceae bacterium]